MDAAALRNTVEAGVDDALSDLGTRAVLVALCDGEPSRSGLLRATWASECAAAGTFDRWADTAGNPVVRATFAATAHQERDHARRVAAVLGDEPSADAPDVPGPLHAYLRGLDVLPARVGAGLVGRPLASLRTYERFIRHADERNDDAMGHCFEHLRRDTEETVVAGAELLEDVGVDDSTWDAAVDAATYTVRLVWDDYADALARQGRSFG